MISGTLRLSERCGRLAAFALVTGLFFVASASAPAFADSPHVRVTATTSSCGACHSVHASAGSALGATTGVRGVTASCLACHDGSDSSASNIASGAADSFGQPSGHSLTAETSGTAHITGCATCHSIHSSSADSPRLPAGKINDVVVSSAGKAVCLACHASSTAWFGPGYPSTSAPTRDATGYPIAGTWPGSSTYDSVSNAHRLVPETTRTVGVSQPVRREQGDCLYCHAAHGGSNAYDGLLTTYTVPSQATLASDRAVGSYAALCFTCHGGVTPSGFATAPVDIKQFATASALATGQAGGHSIVTSGGTLPVGSPLPCFECHNPHGSKRANTSLISDERGASLATTGTTSTDASVRQFCFTCHTTSDTTAAWDSTTATFTPVAPADTVVGLPRDGGVLHLPDSEAHKQAGSTSCYACHGSSYDPRGRNVHNPGTGSIQSFSLALASVPDWSTVPSASLDASAAVDASGSINATASVEASGSAAAAASAATTDSVVPTASVAATGAVQAGLPIVPGALSVAPMTPAPALP